VTQDPQDAPPAATGPHLAFLKVHGAGNDFVLLPDLDDRLDLSADLVRALCDRHLGVGGDGVIRLAPPRPDVDADVFMDYRNADGSIAEMCGNGVRTVAKYVADRGLAAGATVAVDTRAGVKVVHVHRGADGLVDACTVDMGAPVPGAAGQPLALADGSTVAITRVSMGNPHAVLLLADVADVAAAPLATLGPLVERHPAFPDGTNVEVIAVPDRGRVVGRIWERGVGETMASGTGGSAMAVAAVLNGLADRRVAVHLPGGVLQIDWDMTTLHVTGPAVEVAAGTLDAGWLARAGRAAAATAGALR
jgi:diaminopimelate epimerase